MCDVREYLERSMRWQRWSSASPSPWIRARPRHQSQPPGLTTFSTTPAKGTLSRLAANAGARGPTSHRLRLRHLAEPVCWNA